MKDQLNQMVIIPEALLFWGLVQWNGKQCAACPAFNAVLLEGDDPVVVLRAEVAFNIVPT